MERSVGRSVDSRSAGRVETADCALDKLLCCLLPCELQAAGTAALSPVAVAHFDVLFLFRPFRGALRLD
jgi:hypothetical protein